MPDLSRLIYVPLPAEGSAFVSVQPFEAGRMRYKQEAIVEGQSGTLETTVWRFLVSHEASDTLLWFDLGLATNLDTYPPVVRDLSRSFFHCTPASTTPAQDIERVGLSPSSIKFIIASHAHWDHCFPISDQFPAAKLVCGSGTLELACQSYPKFPDSPYDGRLWDATISELPIWDLPSPTNFPSKWHRLGPFENAHDFFGDGSFWLIDAPGHVAGHLVALCAARTTSGVKRWLLLAADSMHSYEFVDNPGAHFGVVAPSDASDTGVDETRGMMHAEPDKARATIQAISSFKRENPGSVVWLGHSAELEGRTQFFV